MHDVTSGRELVLDARVEVLFVLAHDHHVHAGMLGVDERMVGDARPDVGILAERLARGDVQALEAAALRRGDRSFQEDLGAQEGVPGARFDAGGIAAQINLFADLDGLDVESRAGRFQDLERGVHDLRADAVAMGDGDGSFVGHKRNKQDIGMPNTPQPDLAVFFCTACRGPPGLST